MVCRHVDIYNEDHLESYAHTIVLQQRVQLTYLETINQQQAYNFLEYQGLGLLSLTVEQ